MLIKGYSTLKIFKTGAYSPDVVFVIYLGFFFVMEVLLLYSQYILSWVIVDKEYTEERKLFKIKRNIN